MRTKTLEQNTAQDFAGLQVDQLQKLRTGSMSFEQLKWWNNLSFEQREKVMGKQTKSEHPKMKLVSSGIEIPELTEKFDPSKYFTENKKAKYYFGDNFKKYVLNPSKKVSSLPAMSFDKHRFTETIFDKEIMEHFQISESNGLMTNEEILRTIAFLTSKQQNGEEGILQTNGYSTIIGYMLCSDGVVRAVRVHWYSDYSEWYCYCNDLGYWLGDIEMLSRNL